MGDLLKYDSFAIGADPNMGGIPTTTHSLGVPMMIEAPPSIMDTPTPPLHHTPAAARAIKKLPWHRRLFIGMCLRVAVFLQKVGSAEPPRV